jgi:2-methylcitrate dehydratase PrpD
MSGSLDALARFAATSAVHALPIPVVDKAKACLLYAMAVGLACMRAEQPAKAVHAFGTGADGPSTRFLDDVACDPAHAAFANGTLFHARVQDDAHPAGHVGVVVVPATLAMAQATRATGADVIAALVSGYEVALRIGRDHTTDLSARGFRTTPVYGAFGAAAAASRLLHLDETRTAHALALAANMAAGLREYAEAGSEDYAYQAGFGAHAGILAARLAAAGATSSASALEGKGGFFRAYGEPGKRYDARLDADLGNAFEILDVTCKPYPICQFHRGVVQGALALRDAARAVPLEALTIRMHPFEANFFGVRFAGPFESFPQTFMSAPFCAALAFARGAVTLAGLTDFTAADVNALVGRTTVIADEHRPRYAPVLEAQLADGSKHAWSEGGHPQSYALTWPVACAMAASLGAEAGVTGADIDALTAAANDIPRAPTLDPLLDAMRAACRRARSAG